MKKVIANPRSTKTLNLALALILGVVTLAVQTFAQDEHSHDNHVSPATLVKIVRDNTRQFLDVNNAAPNYVPVLGCVSGPDHGAMGIHYLNGALLGGLDATQPQALIYEPVGDARRLVGVEYIVDAATWLKTHDGPPALYGQTFQFVPEPNRFNLHAFFELHVWAWRDNPQGAFVDWNNRVTCEKQ